MANQIQGLRPDGTLPTVAVEHVQQIVSESTGLGVPVFETLAEAVVWEALNPGRTALWMNVDPGANPGDPSDTTPPVPGTLTVSAQDTTATLRVSGASDDLALHPFPYSYSVDGGGTWSPYQASDEYVATGLDPLTPFSGRHRVRDASGNVSVGVAVGFVTEAVQADPISPADVGSLHALFDFSSGQLSGGRIASVSDSAGDRSPLTPTGSSTGPAAVSVGGRQWGQFVATDPPRLSSSTVGVSLPDESITYAMVVRFDTPVDGTTTYALTSGSAPRFTMLGTGRVRLSSVAATQSEVIPVGTTTLMTATKQGGQLTLRVGSLTYTASSDVGFSLGPDMAVGSGWTGQATNITVGAVWVHSKAISQAEHDALLSWARDEFGVD